MEGGLVGYLTRITLVTTSLDEWRQPSSTRQPSKQASKHLTLGIDDLTGQLSRLAGNRGLDASSLHTTTLGR